MGHAVVEFFEVTFTKAELLSLPRSHFGFLVASNVAANDLAIFQRMMVQFSHDASTSDLINQYNSTNYLVLLRNLSAKIIEFVNLIDDFRTTVMRKTKLSTDPFVSKAGEVSDQIKAGSSYALARRLRDGITNHYLAHRTVELVGRFEETLFVFDISSQNDGELTFSSGGRDRDLWSFHWSAGGEVRSGPTHRVDARCQSKAQCVPAVVHAADNA